MGQVFVPMIVRHESVDPKRDLNTIQAKGKQVIIPALGYYAFGNERRKQDACG